MARLRVARCAAAVAAVGLVVGGCARDGGSDAGGVDLGPIKVGAVSSLTGPAPFPDPSAAAKAVFDKVNAEGGIGGRMIEYHVEDDGADPTVSAGAARRLVEQVGVVANVGSASLIECIANGKYYDQVGVRSIQGLGVDPACFGTRSISPVNTGPYAGLTVSLYFASEILKHDRVCVAYLEYVDGIDHVWQAAIDRWAKIAGRPPVYQDFKISPTADFVAQVARAKEAGCQAVAMNGLPPHIMAWAKAAKAQGFTADLVQLTTAYNEDIGAALAAAGIDGLYANAEFEPFTVRSETLAAWRDLMKQAGVTQSAFAEGGYIAASAFVELLRSIKGDITRESVNRALDTFTYQTPLMGTPYTFGTAETHNPNQASKFVRLKAGKWEVVDNEWVRLPG